MATWKLHGLHTDQVITSRLQISSRLISLNLQTSPISLARQRYEGDSPFGNPAFQRPSPSFLDRKSLRAPQLLQFLPPRASHMALVEHDPLDLPSILEVPPSQDTQ